jgi:hypothetical protein
MKIGLVGYGTGGSTSAMIGRDDSKAQDMTCQPPSRRESVASSA